MKKITWFFVNLMLILGMGTASAQKLSVPTTTPADGATVPPGQKVIFGSNSDYKMMYTCILYTFDDAVSLDNLDGQTIQNAVMAPPYNGIYGTYFVGAATSADDPDDPTYGIVSGWMTNPNVPADASGSVTLRARAVDMSGSDASDIATIHYTIAGDAVVTSIAPTFNPAAGPVEAGTRITLSTEAESNYFFSYDIAYVIDNEEIDFEQYTGGKIPTSMMFPRTGSSPIVINGPTKVTAATYKYDENENKIVEWSEKVTATYTIAVAPVVAPNAPTFSPNGGTIALGQQISLATTTEGASIYYTMPGENIPDFSTITTAEELEEATDMFFLYDDDDKFTLEENFGISEEDLADGDITVSLKAAAAVINDGNITWSTTTTATFTVEGIEPPAGTVAQPEITPDGEVGVIKLNQKVTITCATAGASIYYTLDGTTPDATKTLYTAPFLLPENTPVDQEITIRAIAIKDGVSSDARRVVLMVEAAEEGPDDPEPTPITKPNAPKFEIDGTEVTAATLEVKAKKVEVKWIGDETNDNLMVVYTLDGSETVFAAANMGDEILEDALYWEFGDEAFDVTVPATIKAAVAATTQAGDITWSDMVTLSLTSVEIPALPETVTAPTFVPASASVLAKGDAISWTMDASYEQYTANDGLVAVAYVVNGTDADLNIDAKKLDTLMKDYAAGYSAGVRENGKVYLYMEDKDAFLIQEGIEVKARQIVALAFEGEGDEVDIELALSSIVTATYTVDASKLAKPSFKTPIAGSTVEPGSEITFEMPAEYDWTAYTNLAYILYVENNETVALEGTAEEIMNAIPQGPDAPEAEAGELAYKVVNCAKMGDDLSWTKALIATESGALKIRARLAGINLDDEVFYSDEITVSCTVAKGEGPGDDPENPELPETVTAPVFVPAAGEVEKGQAITWTWDEAYSEETYPMVAVAYVVNGEDEALDITVENFGELWNAYTEEDENTVREEGVTYLYRANDAHPYQIDTACTVKARLIIGVANDEGEVQLALSEIVEAAYTIKGEGPVDPSANESTELAGVSIYPNPNSGVFYVELPVAATVEVFASNGVMVKNFTANAGKTTLSLDHSGIYFVRIMGEGLATVKRVIVR